MRTMTMMGALTAILCAQTALAVPTKDELRCELAMGSALTKWQEDAGKCISRCEKRASSLNSGYAECEFPYAGATAECLAKVDAKVVPAVTKKCVGSCPACYVDASGSCMQRAEDALADAQGKFDSAVPGVACEDLPSTQKLEGKCMGQLGTSLGKLIKDLLKCYGKCYKKAQQLDVAAASCVPPASDSITDACVSAAKSKALADVAKRCTPPDGAAPACYGGNPGPFWVNLIDASSGSEVLSTFCGF